MVSQVAIWNINMNEIGVEARADKRLILLKPATIYLRVLNTDAPVEYHGGE